jgi:hypothetical protein
MNVADGNETHRGFALSGGAVKVKTKRRKDRDVRFGAMMSSTTTSGRNRRRNDEHRGAAER